MTGSLGPPDGTPVAIEVRDLRKSFTIPRERQTTVKERALHPGTWLHGEVAKLDALRGISFDVGRGEFFGVIGRNGGGKSTLLKLLASIYQADAGSISVAGRLAPFIELGVGFNPELNAKDNVLLNGVMMGLTPREARARFDRVIDYAELWDYTDLKLKNYSFGMQVRLGFSMMLQVDADVLLVDEVLAVGDLAFQEKCIDSLRELKGGGTAIVLVTHEMEDVERHCDRAMLIEDGIVEAIGEPGSVTQRFVDVILPAKQAGMRTEGPAGVSAAWIADAGGQATQTVNADAGFSFRVTLYANDPLDSPVLDIELLSHPEGVRLSSFSVEESDIGALAAGEQVTARLDFESDALRPGEYRMRYALRNSGDPGRTLDRSQEPIRLNVRGRDLDRGAVTIPHRVSIERAETGAPR
ncbi:MAG TPA: ABC transporter ATP-binding protein [Solirubrobacterales bacterium]